MVLAPITVNTTSIPQTPPPASLTVIGLVAGLEDFSTVLSVPARPHAIRTMMEAELVFRLCWRYVQSHTSDSVDSRCLHRRMYVQCCGCCYY